jgi:hypothetical protein
LAELERARQVAEKAMNGSAMAMAMATMGKAKILGLIIDRRCFIYVPNASFVKIIAVRFNSPTSRVYLIVPTEKQLGRPFVHTVYVATDSSQRSAFCFPLLSHPSDVVADFIVARDCSPMAYGLPAAFNTLHFLHVKLGQNPRVRHVEYAMQQPYCVEPDFLMHSSWCCRHSR